MPSLLQIQDYPHRSPTDSLLVGIAPRLWYRYDEPYAELRQFPIIPCTLCGSQENLQRKQVTAMLRDWEKRFPGRVDSIFNALANVVPTHLLDRVSHFVGIAYPPDLILLLAVLFLMVLVFHLSLSLARLSAKQTALVQEIGLMTTMSPSTLGTRTSDGEDGDAGPRATGAGPTPTP